VETRPLQGVKLAVTGRPKDLSLRQKVYGLVDMLSGSNPREIKTSNKGEQVGVDSLAQNSGLDATMQTLDQNIDLSITQNVKDFSGMPGCST
jgi:hypothetical protein